MAALYAEDSVSKQLITVEENGQPDDRKSNISRPVTQQSMSKIKVVTREN
jgi:hypothetical protein